MAHDTPPAQTTHEYQLALGARLVAAFEQKPAGQDILRRVLCLGNIPEGLPATMLAWMRNYPSLRVLQEELVWCLPAQSPTAPVAVALGPLLAWASNQEWADNIAWSELLRETRRTLGCTTPLNAAIAMDYALRIMQPCFSLLQPERRNTVLDAWLEPSVLWQCPRWSPKEVYPAMANAWVSLGLLAEMTPCLQGTFSPLLRWHAMVQETLYTLMPWDQTAIIDVLLDSTLSETSKVLAACSGDPEGLDNVLVIDRLRACLPLDEVARISFLAWASPVGSRYKSGSPRTYMVHEASEVNRRMVRTFCPELYGILDCLVLPKDWAEKHKILAHVQTFQAPSSHDALALPMNLEPTSEMA